MRDRGFLILQLNSVADFEAGLTHHQQELEGFRIIFSALAEQVANLNNTVIKPAKSCQRLERRVTEIEDRQNLSEAAQQQTSIFAVLRDKIFALCTLVLNWQLRQLQKVARRFPGNPHQE